MRWWWVVLLGVLGAAAWSPVKADPESALEGFSLHRLHYDGRERSYYLRLPPGYQPSRRYPLLVLLHGGGGSAAQALRHYPLRLVTDREGVILVAPDGTGPLASRQALKTWNVGFGFGYAKRHQVDDLGFLRALLLELRQKVAVDQRRVFLTGMSNGGILCHQFAARHSDLVAGIAPVVATVGGRAVDQPAMVMPSPPSQPVDVIMFCGALDRSIPLKGGWQTKHAERHPVEVLSAEESAQFWVRHNGCHPTPEVVEYPEQRVTRKIWSGGRDGRRVVLIILHDQGHAWPGARPSGRRVADPPSTTLSAHEVLWEFFRGQQPAVSPRP